MRCTDKAKVITVVVATRLLLGLDPLRLAAAHARPHCVWIGPLAGDRMIDINPDELNVVVSPTPDDKRLMRPDDRVQTN